MKKLSMASVHTGHRKRATRQFLEYGGEHLEEHELLERILFYTHPQGDVNPLAHQLIDRFGSLKAVLDAPREELVKVVGITDRSVMLFKLMIETARRYQMADTQPGVIVTGTEEAAEVLRPYFVGATVEQLYMLSIDAKGKMLGCDRISRGAVDEVLVDQRRVVERALSRRAVQVVLAHCHVTGVAAPSRADIQATDRLRQTLLLLGIRLVDHLIFADGDYVSMAQSNLIRDFQ